MKTYKLLLFLLLSIAIACKQEKRKHTVLFYTDSSFTQKEDSLFIDSLQQIKQEHFVKIIEPDKKSFEQGKIVNGIKVGKWQKYLNLSNQNTIHEEYNYSQKGDLINAKIWDPKTHKMIEDKNYLNDNLVGIQQDFYPTGKLHIRFETDQNGSFINNYTVLSKEGKKVYQSFLGKTGTGYIKYYDKDHFLIWEGRFKNKKKVGWHYEYLIGYEGKVIEKQCNYYKEDSLIQTKINNSKNK
ncbi:hypothetical protein [Flavobacterium covae]|nr:hypothetical protein [Flavobacterium covae]MCJ1809089.1 hypothetical protein [Flavobacterium covae]